MQGEYLTISTFKDLRALRDYLLDPEVPVIWFDTETTGLSWQKVEMLCIGFAGQAGEGFTVPVLWNDGGDIDLFPAWQRNPQAFISILREIFGSDKPKGGHNVLFDLRILERDNNDPWVTAATAFGIEVKGELICTELLHHSIAEALPHNMTTTLALYTDMAYYEDEIKKYKKHMDTAPNEMIWLYQAQDADGLPRLHEPMRKQADKEGVSYVLDNITQPMLRVCREIEQNGFPIDVPYFEALCQFYQQEVERAEEELWEAVPSRDAGWKYNYAPTLREVLFKDLNLPMSSRKTKSGAGCEQCGDSVCFAHSSTGRDALLEIQGKLKRPHPALDAVLELKNLTKRRGTYLDGGRGGFKRYLRVDNRIHPSMKISRAETGRLASEEPNSQNIPNYVHIHQHGDLCYGSKEPCAGLSCTHNHDHCKAFYSYTFGINTTNAFHDMVRAPKGKVILNVDWSQLEIWVLAYRIYSDIGDRTLLDVLLSGTDIHLWMARKMYPKVDPQLSEKEWKEAHPILRRRAKTANFGIGFGLTVQGYMNKENCTEEEAEEVFTLFKSIVPIDRWFKHIIKLAETKGYVRNEFGRRRHLRYLKILKAMGVKRDYEAALREAINFPIQSTGSDLHSAASFRAYVSKKLRSRGCRIILSVHDSLTFEADAPDNDYVKDTAWIVKSIFEETAKNLRRPDGTPLDWQVPVECEWGTTWGTPEFKLNARGQLEEL